MIAVKGPWGWVWEHGSRQLRNAEGHTIMCGMSYYPWTPDSDEEWDLIAAAPELYEVLDECINGLDCQPGYVKSLTIQKALVALRKARGDK